MVRVPALTAAQYVVLGFRSATYRRPVGTETEPSGTEAVHELGNGAAISVTKRIATLPAAAWMVAPSIGVPALDRSNVTASAVAPGSAPWTM